jgi:type II secretory pathway pseudopilin PulG
MKRRDGGFSLVEVLLAMSLMFVGMMAAAPLFVFSMKETAAGADLGTVGAAAVDRMELLRATGFDALAAGGSLTGNVAGYSDATHVQYTVRWQITDNGTPATVKTVSVLAIASRQAMGLAKEVTLASLRGR